jgi:hypothetical protein
MLCSYLQLYKLEIVELVQTRGFDIIIAVVPTFGQCYVSNTEMRSRSPSPKGQVE